jgi:hypothetical protein
MPSEPLKPPKGRTLNNPSHPKWQGTRGAIASKLVKRAERTARANRLNPTFKPKPQE